MKKTDQTPQTNRTKKTSCGCRKGGKSNEAQQNPAHVMQELSHEANSDVLGSYTGTPADGGDPVQDADDL